MFLSDCTKSRGNHYVDINNKTVYTVNIYFSLKNITARKSFINRKAYTFPMYRFLTSVTEEKNPRKIMI